MCSLLRSAIGCFIINGSWSRGPTGASYGNGCFPVGFVGDVTRGTELHRYRRGVEIRRLVRQDIKKATAGWVKAEAGLRWHDDIVAAGGQIGKAVITIHVGLGVERLPTGQRHGHAVKANGTAQCHLTADADHSG